VAKHGLLQRRDKNTVCSWVLLYEDELTYYRRATGA